MPRKKKTTTEVVEEVEQTPDAPAPEANVAPAIDVEAVDVTPEQPDPVQQDVMDFLSTFAGQSVVVKIYRYTTSGKTEYVSEGDLDVVNEKFIQDNYGGGRYRLMVYKTDRPQGIMANRTIHIAGPAKSALMPPPVVENKADPTITLLQMQIENMNNQNRQTQEMMLKMIEQFGKVAAGREESSSMPELIESLSHLKSFMTPAQSTNPLDLINGILPLATKLIDLGAGRGPSESGGFGDIVKDIVKEVPNILKGFSMAKMQSTPAPVQIERPAVSAAPGAKPKLDLNDPYVQQIQGYLGFLKSRCLAGQDVDFWIETVLNTLDTEQSDLVIKLLDRPYEEIAQIDPDLMNIRFKTWFENFFGGLKDALLDNGASAGETGNPGDVAANGGADPASLPDKPGN